MNKFKCETQEVISETRDGIKTLDAALKALPHTIRIAATQVYHPKAGWDDENDAPALTVEGSLDQHVDRMDKIEAHASNEINRVVEWVTEQRKEDQHKLDSLQEAFERVENDLKDTISYAEVEEKIAVKVRELVNHIKEALLAVEEDEADFKNVASSLHGLFNSLKESKADKSEMAQVCCTLHVVHFIARPLYPAPYSLDNCHIYSSLLSYPC